MQCDHVFDRQAGPVSQNSIIDHLQIASAVIATIHSMRFVTVCSNIPYFGSIFMLTERTTQTVKGPFRTAKKTEQKTPAAILNQTGD